MVVVVAIAFSSSAFWLGWHERRRGGREEPSTAEVAKRDGGEELDPLFSSSSSSCSVSIHSNVYAAKAENLAAASYIDAKIRPDTLFCTSTKPFLIWFPVNSRKECPFLARGPKGRHFLMRDDRSKWGFFHQRKSSPFPPYLSLQSMRTLTPFLFLCHVSHTWVSWETKGPPSLPPLSIGRYSTFSPPRSKKKNFPSDNIGWWLWNSSPYL